LGKQVPLLVKLAPDLEPAELEQIIECLLGKRIDGVIATNTTIRRENLASPRSAETGGLSGQPLKSMSTNMISLIAGIAGHDLPIIGVGGIASPADAVEKIKAGASLVQLYTGLIYQGPQLVKQIVEQLK
jgi:dihydroorotate dehydrogenase